MNDDRVEISPAQAVSILLVFIGLGCGAVAVWLFAGPVATLGTLALVCLYGAYVASTWDSQWGARR